MPLVLSAVVPRIVPLEVSIGPPTGRLWDEDAAATSSVHCNAMASDRSAPILLTVNQSQVLVFTRSDKGGRTAEGDWYMCLLHSSEHFTVTALIEYFTELAQLTETIRANELPHRLFRTPRAHLVLVGSL